MSMPGNPLISSAVPRMSASVGQPVVVPNVKPFPTDFVLKIEKRVGAAGVTVALGVPPEKFTVEGKEYTPTAENADKFATYHRDFSALDYADQRYSRFWSTGP